MKKELMTIHLCYTPLLKCPIKKNRFLAIVEPIVGFRVYFRVTGRLPENGAKLGLIIKRPNIMLYSLQTIRQRNKL